MSAVPVEKPRYRTLKVPDPAHLVMRLKQGVKAGVLSRVQRTAFVGQEFLLVNERLKEGETTKAWARVRLGQGAAFRDGAIAVETLGAKVDSLTAREFSEVKEQVWFHPLVLLEAYDSPRDVTGVTPGGRRYTGEGTVEKQDGLDPGALKELSTHGLLAVLAALEREFEQRGFDASKSEDLINSARFILDELDRRGEKSPTGKLADEAAGMVSKDFAPIAASGEKKGRPIILDEVLDSFGDAMIRHAAVSVVGGVVNHGQTENDIDVLIKGPLDPATRKVIEFRIGRMLADKDPELADRTQFLEDELGGPFTPHVEAFDLVLVRRPEREVIQMAAAEKADPITELAEKPGPKRAVLQFHARGRTLHADLRLQQDGHLIGWTLAIQRAGAIPDINTIDQLRDIRDEFDVNGSSSLKPLLAPAKLQAFPKTRQPVEWLEAKDQVIKPGEVGATAEEEGVLVVVDRPVWEEGRVEPYYREMFFSGGKHLNGVVHARKLVGRGDGEGRAASGETFWNIWLSKEALPSILSTRAVRRGTMPPDGRSWIPRTLEQVTPKKYRYWEHKGAEAKRIRDELVKARYFTDDNVRVVSGRFRRVVTKHYLATDPDPIAKRDGRGPLQRPHRCKTKGCEKQGTVAIVWADGRAFVPACDEHRGYWENKLADIVSVRPLPQPSEKDGYVPPAAAREEAKRGLEWRRQYGRGGTDIGVARARDISNGRALSLDTVKRMRSYFARHAVDREGEGWNSGESGYPSAGRIAWLLWGGDPGRKWAERIVTREDAKKAADVRRFVLARQAYKGQQVVREGPTKTTWFLMFPAGAAMHMIRMDADPTEESSAVAGVHVHVNGTDLMKLDGPADPGLSVNGYKVNPTKNTPSDWRIVDSGKVAVLEEEPNRWLLNFSGQDLSGRWEAEAEEPGSKLWTLRRDGRVAKAIPERDGIKIWDPKRKDPDADRTELKPLAIFSPQKPSDRNEFHTPDEAVIEFATPEKLKAGIVVEPKLNGRVVVLERDAEGRVVIFFEDSLRDRSRFFPGLAKATRELGRPAILVGELIDYDEDGNPLPRRELARFGQDKVHDDSGAKVHVFDVLYWGRQNSTDWPVDERRGLRSSALRGKAGTFVNVPGRVATSEAELKDAIHWASKQPASEGAMLKTESGTYSLGGQTSSDAKVKLVREVRAIVLGKETKKPAPSQQAPARTYVYECGVGPVPKSEDWRGIAEQKGRRFVTIGKTFATNVSAEIGDVLRVEVTELLLDSGEKIPSLTWFTPMVVDKADRGPMTVDDVKELLRSDEVKKADGPWIKTPVIKAEDQRYVFGVVLEPNDGDDGNPLDPDLQRDAYSAEEIWNAWKEYTAKSRKLGLLHERIVGNNKMILLDNYVAPCDMLVGDQKIRKGSWCMGALITDDVLWRRIKDGTYAAWSIDGSAIRQLMRRAA